MVHLTLIFGIEKRYYNANGFVKLSAAPLVHIMFRGRD